MIIGVCAAITFALTSVFNRKLKSIHYAALMVYHGLIGITATSIIIVIEAIVKGGFRFYTGR